MEKLENIQNKQNNQNEEISNSSQDLGAIFSEEQVAPPPVIEKVSLESIQSVYNENPEEFKKEENFKEKSEVDSKLDDENYYNFG